MARDRATAHRRSALRYCSVRLFYVQDKEQAPCPARRLDGSSWRSRRPARGVTGPTCPGPGTDPDAAGPSAADPGVESVVRRWSSCWGSFSRSDGRSPEPCTHRAPTAQRHAWPSGAAGMDSVSPLPGWRMRSTRQIHRSSEAARRVGYRARRGPRHIECGRRPRRDRRGSVTYRRRSPLNCSRHCQVKVSGRH